MLYSSDWEVHFPRSHLVDNRSPASFLEQLNSAIGVYEGMKVKKKIFPVAFLCYQGSGLANREDKRKVSQLHLLAVARTMAFSHKDPDFEPVVYFL